MPILRVSPWEFSSLRKNANDLTPSEFHEWLFARYPYLRNLPLETHDAVEIKVVVDWESDAPPAVLETAELPTYVLVLKPR